MAVVSVREDQFDTAVRRADKPVLVDFWASWCGPCRKLSPLVESIAKEHPEIQVAKVNVDEEPVLAQRYRIASVPTLLLFKEGEIAARTVGVRPRQEIEQMIIQ